jgi:4-nitrophenyl phosphatase
MDGTFNLGDRLIDGSMRFIETLERQGKSYIFLTNNSSKNRRMYAEKIARLGLRIPEDMVFTSGEATALYLKSVGAGLVPAPGLASALPRIFLAGTPALEEEFRSHGFTLVEENPELVVLGFDTTLTYNKLWKLCDLVRAGLPYIATHPDFNCPTETGYMPDTGAMIAFIQASTGREPDVVVGKPNRIIVDALAEKLGLRLQDIAMVGDRLYTDIALGKSAGILTCLVLSGEATESDLVDSPFQPSYIFKDLGELADWLQEHEE